MTLSAPMSPQAIAETILSHYPQNFKPRMGIVLGSGLGSFTDFLEEKVAIPYHQIPDFPNPSVKGHHGELVMGYYGGMPIVCLKGRVHLYEGINPAYIKTYVRTLKCLGCEYFIATNASGSLDLEMPPGEIMMITDHINFMPINPLVGANDDEFGPRFLPMDQAYDPDVQGMLRKAADNCGFKLHEGVYFAVQGPQYETAAEIRAFKLLGANAVGMSTVPEVMIAHHAGMKVGALATITNYATGLAQKSHDHNEVVRVAEQASENLQKIIQQMIKNLV